MLLRANEETIGCLVAEGVLLLQAFHEEHKIESAGNETEFLRGSFTSWHNTIHTKYHSCAEEIVNRVLVKTGLCIPQGGIARPS